MSLPHRRPVPWSAASPLALAAACLVVLISNAATGAAPPEDPTAEPAWCASALSRLSDAAVRLGYSIHADAHEIAASRGRDGLHATCSAGQVAIELAEETGSQVTVVSDPSGLEIVGQYPGMGTVARTGLVESATADPPTGSLTFAADARGLSAFVEFDLAGDVMADGGDTAVVNEQLAPVLAGSAIWKDAHVLTLALAGMWGREDDPIEAGLDLVLGVAVPNPRAGIKKSMVGIAMTCGKSAVMCTLAAGWIPPLVHACYGDSVTCALAIGCALVSCID